MLTVPLPPTTLTVTRQTTSSLKVEWTNNQARSVTTHWNMSYKEKGRDNWIVNNNIPVNTVMKTITGLTAGMNYTIRVFAVSFSSTVSTTSTSEDATVGKVFKFSRF